MRSDILARQKTLLRCKAGREGINRFNSGLSAFRKILKMNSARRMDARPWPASEPFLPMGGLAGRVQIREAPGEAATAAWR